MPTVWKNMNPRYTRYYTYIKPFIKNKAVRTYGSLVFSLITAAIFIVFAIRPTLSTIISLQKSISQQKETLEQIKSKTSNLQNGKRNFEVLASDQKKLLADLIPYNPKVADLIDALTQVSLAHQASISGLQFQSIEVYPDTAILSKEAALKPIEFTLNIQGSFSQMVSFLESLSLSKRLVKVDSATFSKPAAGSLILSINAKAYYIKN